VADYRSVGRRIAVITAGIDDSEREGVVFHDLIPPVIEVVNEHIVFPVQRKGKIYPVGGFLDIGKDRSPLAEVPLIRDTDEIIVRVFGNLSGPGAETVHNSFASEETAVLTFRCRNKRVCRQIIRGGPGGGIETVFAD
jgi:hypothetical protein